MSNLFVLGLGLGTVFVGLICIIILCKLMSAICSKIGKNPTQPAVVVPSARPPLRLKRLFRTGRSLLLLSPPSLLKRWGRTSRKFAFFLFKKFNTNLEERSFDYEKVSCKCKWNRL